MGKLKVEDILFWGLIIFVLVMLAWRVFGHSPGMEELIGALVGSEILLWRHMYKHGRELEKVSSKLDRLDSIEKSLEDIKRLK